MDTTRDEKTIRLYNALQEALKPMLEKLDKMEQEMKALQENQEELRKMLEEKVIK